MSEEKKMIKFFCRKPAVDYKGNIITITKEADVEWKNYDPSLFMNNAMLSGNVEDNPPPCETRDSYFIDHNFHIDSWDAKKRSIVIESETIQNMKYVVLDTIKHIENKWVEV